MAPFNAPAVIERAVLVTSPSATAEVSAMAEICEILRSLPDEASRLRVMRWSFGRFNPEFKRPVSDRQEPAPMPGVHPAAADITAEIAAVAPEIAAAPAPARREAPDFGRQLSELEDLFPAARRPREAAVAPSFNLDALDALDVL